MIEDPGGVDVPDPRDMVAPVDEGAEVAPPTPLRDDEPDGGGDRRADEQRGDPGGKGGHRPFTGEIPHATEPDEPPRR